MGMEHTFVDAMLTFAHAILQKHHTPRVHRFNPTYRKHYCDHAAVHLNLVGMQ